MGLTNVDLLFVRRGDEQAAHFPWRE